MFTFNNNYILKKVLFLSVLAIFSHAKESGKTLYSTKGCYACHGVDAKGNSSYPKLANKPESYLILRLKAYKKEKIRSKRSDIMTSYAKNLSEKEIKEIASFLSALKSDTTKKEEYYDDDFLTNGEAD